MTSRRSFLCLALLLTAAANTAGARQSERPAARPDFSGTWTLDREISTDPSQVSFATPSEQPRAGFGRGGFGRRGEGGFGGRGGRFPTNTPKATPDDRLKALADELRSAFTAIVVSHHDPSFVVSDAAEHAQFFHTNGESDENHLGAATLTSTTYWEGDRLIVEYSLNDRRRLVYTYALVPQTRQLVIRVRLEEGRTGSEEVRLVYSLTPSKS
jgi:hypothetical protein